MLLLSIKVTEKELEQHKASLQALTAFMKTEYPGLTTGDLLLAYRFGVKYLLGIEMYAELNPRQVGKVLHAYEQFKREELTRNPAPAPAPVALLPEALPTPEQQDRANAQLFFFAYQAARQKREYRDHGNLLYNWLDGKKLIPFPPERKWEFMNLAQEKIRQEEMNHGVTGNMQEHKDARNLAELIKQAQEQNEFQGSIKDRITTRAKQLAFTALLNDVIEMDITPVEYLNSNSQ